MAENSKRSRFQFRLSTALFMMILAGVLLWSQSIVRIEKRPYSIFGDWKDEVRGWPAVFLKRSTEDTANSEVNWINIKLDSTVSDVTPDFYRNWKLSIESVVIDSVVSLFFLILGGYLFESITRRRSKP